MHKLAYYQNKFNHLALQGTKEWLESRSYSFGGSEIGTVMGENKNEDWDDLVHKKVVNTSYRSDFTEWGHLFEPVSKIFIEKMYGTIYEFGSIPHTYLPVCYSPDGLMVIDDKLILLEIKNPIMRGVNSIPEHYLSQVKTGMAIINVSYCMFWQFRFRRCKLGTGPWNMIYDRKYHKEYRKRCPDKGNISFGYLYWDIDCDLVDLGSVDSILDELKAIPVEIIPQILIEPSEFHPVKGKVLMWKLFEKSKTIIEPVKNYLMDKEDYLWDKYKELRSASIKSLPKPEIQKVEETLISQVKITCLNTVQETEDSEADDPNLKQFERLCNVFDMPELENDSESADSV